jgi:hypothetical protein
MPDVRAVQIRELGKPLLRDAELRATGANSRPELPGLLDTVRGPSHCARI